MQPFARHFSDTSFWETVPRAARRAGRGLVEEALTLFHCLRDDDTPAWARAVILGALGYFVLPADAVPDILPGVGFGDDLSTFLGAATCVAFHVKPEHRDRARRFVAAWA